jgi:phosphatidyl-myo-inositol dimannoside synthase
LGPEFVRVLIVTFDPPENIGGIEGRVIGLLRELPACDVQVEVAALGTHYSAFRGQLLGAPYIRASSRPRDVLISLTKIRREIVARQIDAVFLLSGATTLLGNLILLEAWVLRTKSAVLFYGRDVLQAKKKPWSRLFFLASLLVSKKVVTNSSYTSSLIPSFARQDTALLYPTVDGSVVLSLEKERPSGKTILFVGRLVERKGVDDLLRALPLVKNKISEIRLEIVGDGPQRKELERITANLGLSGSVRFFGELRGEDLANRYRQCTIFAMSSKSLKDDVEGFGTVYLEASLYGKPSVGTKTGGIPEAILDGETGILVEGGDVSGLATALTLLLTDESLALRLGENARKRVLTGFTWQKGARKLAQILEGI